MKQIYDILEGLKLGTVPTQEEVLAARHRLQELVPTVDSWRTMAHLYSQMVAKAQVFNFIGFRNPQARWLAKEVDCYPVCANG